MDKKYITTSHNQTRKLGEDFAKEILKLPLKNRAVVLGLCGNLGGGKTTFLQGFAKGLGIKEKILSPTFVILKKFKIKKTTINFYHIDCYRLENDKDALFFGLKEIINDSKNIIAIEWSERIKNILPKGMVIINFKFIDKNRREITFKM